MGLRSKTTVDQRGEDYHLQDGQFCTSCRPSVIRQFWKRFVLDIAITGLVGKRGRNSSWKQHATCFKLIFRFSIGAKWRNENWNLKDDNSWKPINGQIKLSEREYMCVANWWWSTVCTRKATQEVAKKLKKWRDAAGKKKMKKLNKSSMDILCSMIRDHEQRVYDGIKYENEKNDWSSLKIRKSSKILTHRTVLAVPTFHIKLVFSRVPKSLAAIRECSEIHEKM